MESLLARKQELYDALRTLKHDFEDGAIDPEAYQAARSRYELEAADILARLDEQMGIVQQSPPARRLSPRFALVLSLLGAAVAVAVILFGALRDRPPATNAASQPPLPPTIRAAATAVARHPRSESAAIGLGNAYLNIGDARDAETSFARAETLAPSDPEAQTMRAVALSALGSGQVASMVLRQVEQEHPRYAKAWLVDGMLAARKAGGRKHALLAFQRFLALQPHSPVSSTVRRLAGRLKGPS